MPPHTSHASQQRMQRLRTATGAGAAAESDPSVAQSDALVPTAEQKGAQSQERIAPNSSNSISPLAGRGYAGAGGYGMGVGGTMGTYGGYGGSSMYGSYGGYGGYGSSGMYGPYSRYGGYGMGGYGGGYGMGGYGGYGMGGYGGYGTMGMDGAGSGWLFNLHLLLTSMGQLTELIGMNTQALQYFFGNVVGLVDGALQLLSPSPPELLEDAEIHDDDDEHTKRIKIQQQRREREIKRLKFIRWALILLAAFAQCFRYRHTEQ